MINCKKLTEAREAEGEEKISEQNEGKKEEEAEEEDRTGQAKLSFSIPKIPSPFSFFFLPLLPPLLPPLRDTSHTAQNQSEPAR